MISASGIRVSIRSPYRSKGRYNLVHRPLGRHSMFQSAPLTEARGDEAGSRCQRIVTTSVFQSAPLTEARGDAA